MTGPPPTTTRNWTGPLGLLLGQMACVAVLLGVTGRLTPVRVNDTPSYVEFPWNALESVLGDKRTPGYPLFLKMLQPLSPDWQIVPGVQLAAYCGSTLILYFSLAGVAGRWSRSMIAGSLLWANILWGYVQTIATDTLAAAAGIAAVALTIDRATSAGGRRIWKTAVLALVVSSAWLIRPAAVFLIVLVPALGAMLAAADSSARRRSWRRELAILTLASVLPATAYCALRAKVIGRFGIVSFGGYNLIGISGQFLDEGVLPQIPEDLHAIAVEALRRREEVVFTGPDLPQSERLNYDRMEWRYDDTIWKVFTPAAQAIEGGDNGRLNSQLKRLAIALIRARPLDYVVWLAKATRQGTRKLVSDFVLNPAILATLFLLVGLQIATTVRGPREVAQLAGAQPSATAILFLVSACYASASLAVVILVCPPLGRMTDAAAPLLATPLVAAVCDRASRLRERRERAVRSG